jgi:uncharacterized protein (DUF2147 family)
MTFLLSFLTSIVLHTGVYSPKADAIVGVWMTEEKESKIEIYKKGNAYYGKIIWLKEPKTAAGKTKTDINNPDASKRDQPILGLNLLSGLKWDASESEWNEGEVYDPKSGKTYSIFAKLQGEKQLYLKGYIGISLIGSSTVWTRVQ